MRFDLILQIWLIFRHLQMWLATAIHSCKWLKIVNELLTGLGVTTKLELWANHIISLSPKVVTRLPTGATTAHIEFK